MPNRNAVIVIAIAIVSALFYSQFTFFVIQPIGAIPEGQTFLISRGSSDLSFVDSPDAVCNRLQGGVSLLCRGLTLTSIVSRASVKISLPYSSFLYNLSIQASSPTPVTTVRPSYEQWQRCVDSYMSNHPTESHNATEDSMAQRHRLEETAGRICNEI